MDAYSTAFTSKLALDPPKTTNGLEQNIAVQEIQHDRVKFAWEGVDLSLANGLRRVLQSEIPTLAIGYISVKHNSSVLPDEFLAHRLALIPLQSTGIAHKLEKERDLCGCDDGCDECTVMLQLDVACRSAGKLDVTSKDLVVLPRQDGQDRGGFGMPMSEHSNGILIAQLGPGQRITLLATAHRGIALDHAKHCPVSTVGFEYDPHNKLHHTDLWSEQKDAKDRVSKSTWVKTPNAKYEREPPSEDAVDWSGQPSRFYFDVETVNSLPPFELVQEGLEVLIRKLAVITQAIEKMSVDRPQMGASTPGQAGFVVNQQTGAGIFQNDRRTPAVQGVTPAFGGRTPAFGGRTPGRYTGQPNGGMTPGNAPYR
ncbi:uncharacterized protein L969DRAFT_85779 [Mixia osmundae IAM 14324]|uniref:DNA-directed RNA polymerase RpoA/D/Rpb3-type domain-containing protein n=1 Tax=Mixia osmundae (strain CBS 9802 / IAM 14324 / JCM 22182 / KY 12970) TaxID=764103 RepID=G7E608_MIXOS|nr:uncharacterized protein L969DRAFT_85779 [Mixia osmundae IAM 14324]KEI40584.1 hypothetical protein L969DRAFT_85779 [Mixia osmundae IAM 14324]GAA98268.1 hypothetical protein E5Q_04951 [Mixia osmundae IAM 14324]